MSRSVRQIYNFATAIEGLKKLERFKGQYFWKDYPKRARYESVAEHSWRLTVLVALFASFTRKKLNVEKAMKMALIHDLAEIIAGDISPLGNDGTGRNTHAYDAKAKKKKFEKEKRAAEKLFRKLPPRLGKELLGLWHECETHRTFESKVVQALDKLECILQVQEYRRGHMFKEHLAFNFGYGTKYAHADPAIEAFGKLITGNMRKTFRPYHKRNAPH